jgi:fatty acid desaturase
MKHAICTSYIFNTTCIEIYETVEQLELWLFHVGRRPIIGQCYVRVVKALLHGKASIAILVSWSLSVYTLNQVACFMQSLLTNCSHQNGESWQWRHSTVNTSIHIPISWIKNFKVWNCGLTQTNLLHVVPN